VEDFIKKISVNYTQYLVKKKYNELDNNLNDSKGKRGFFFLPFFKNFFTLYNR